VRYIATDAELFARLLGTVKKLRDRHTCIKLPAPLDGAVAFLPFALESCWDGSHRVLMVTKLLSDVGDPEFIPGVEVTHWNGVPVATYVERLAEQNEGGNAYARIAIALRSLTMRPLAYMLLPDEDWVTLSYVSARGYRSITVPWRVYFPAPGAGVQRGIRETSQGDITAKGIDRASYLVNGAWQDLFTSAEAYRVEPSSDVFLDPDPLASVPNPLSDMLGFRLVRYQARVYGYLRIFSFDTPDPAGFLRSLSEILQVMPPTGLILDLRANPGGTIPVGEAMLQMFTTRAIQPEKVAFRVTSGVRSLVAATPALAAWRRSLDMRYETGQMFSQGFPLYDPTLSEGMIGIYPHPVVMIMDSLCYSTTDFVVAGFQDNRIGPVIGTDVVTGAGGANVWTHSQLQQLVGATGQTLCSLPGGFDINIALRRSTRIGFNEDIPVEGLGVFADHVYRMTQRDVLGKNEDLIRFAAHVLSGA
jgi:hypothetical protein